MSWARNSITWGFWISFITILWFIKPSTFSLLDFSDVVPGLLWTCFAIFSILFGINSYLSHTSRLRLKKLQMGSDELHFVEVSDSWKIALYHYNPRVNVITKNFPVLLCHGLSSNRLVFDFNERLSLARYLAASGYDVWVTELRGSNLSFHSGFGSAHATYWDFDDHLEKDIPKAIDYILRSSKISPAPSKVHYIGHSMGGNLLLCYLALNEANCLKIRSAVTLGSTISYHNSGSGYKDLLPLTKLSWLVPNSLFIPVGTFFSLLSPLMGRVSFNPVEKFQIYPPNIDPRVARSLFRFGFHKVPIKLALHLQTAVRNPLGMSNRSNSAPYAQNLIQIAQRFPHIVPPLLLVGGDKDLQCPPKAVRNTIDILGSVYANIRVQIFGKDNGHKEHYGHVDLLLGKNAVEEVYPIVEGWLFKHDLPFISKLEKTWKEFQT